MEQGLSQEVDGKLRQFIRVLMSYVDFQQAGGIASHILDLDLHERYPRDRFLLQGLNCGMVIAYCRPFSGNDRRSETKIPDLPGRILDVLSEAERGIHEELLEERNTVLAHSDSDAWDPTPVIFRRRGHDMLVPSFNYVHLPVTREATEQIMTMSHRLLEACASERQRLEPELRQFLPVLEPDEDELRRWAEEAGLPPLP